MSSGNFCKVDYCLRDACSASRTTRMLGLAVAMRMEEPPQYVPISSLTYSAGRQVTNLHIRRSLQGVTNCQVSDTRELPAC